MPIDVALDGRVALPQLRVARVGRLRRRRRRSRGVGGDVDRLVLLQHRRHLRVGVACPALLGFLAGCSTLLTLPVAFIVGPSSVDVDARGVDGDLLVDDVRHGDARLAAGQCRARPCRRRSVPPAAVADDLAVLEPDAAARTRASSIALKPGFSADVEASPSVASRSDRRRRFSRNSTLPVNRALVRPAPGSPSASSVARLDRARAGAALVRRQRRAARSRAPRAPSASSRRAPARCRCVRAAICRPGCPGFAGQLDRRVAADERVLSVWPSARVVQVDVAAPLSALQAAGRRGAAGDASRCRAARASRPALRPGVRCAIAGVGLDDLRRRA